MKSLCVMTPDRRVKEDMAFQKPLISFRGGRIRPRFHVIRTK